MHRYDKITKVESWYYPVLRAWWSDKYICHPEQKALSIAKVQRRILCYRRKKKIDSSSRPYRDS